MKRLFLFDVDGTLVESGQIISDDMRDILMEMQECGHEIGIVGGGTYEKIKRQLKDIVPDYVFSECGSVYHNKEGKQIYSKHLRFHILYPHIQNMIRLAMVKIAMSDHIISGHFIDLRNGLLYISLLGMNGTMDERVEFILNDRLNGYRKQLIKVLQEYCVENGLDTQLSVVEGGKVGISVYPSEWDKRQVMDIIDVSAYSEIHYFGDRYEIDGNDYTLLHHPHIIPHPVEDAGHTLQLIRFLLLITTAQ